MKTHCKHGHELSGSNVAIRVRACRKNDTRVCLTCKKEAKRTHYLKTNGWTEHDIEFNIAMQDNRCAICKELFSESNKPCADHKHSSPPEPRGVLCNHCNLGIGNLKESIVILEAAMVYLKKYL